MLRATQQKKDEKQWPSEMPFPKERSKVSSKMLEKGVNG